MAQKTMKQITKFYLSWHEPANRPHRNKHLTELEELIDAIDNPDPGESPVDAAIRKITEHMGDAPNADAQTTLTSIIDSDMTNAAATVSAVEILKHICMLQGGDEGKRSSVNPPNPWK